MKVVEVCVQNSGVRPKSRMVRTKYLSVCPSACIARSVWYRKPHSDRSSFAMTAAVLFSFSILAINMVGTVTVSVLGERRRGVAKQSQRQFHRR
ncbi:hypothetical protein AcW1_009349 [Taiwanofungus camphoratus]|nr:hypothetical protein AcW1_009349 [Antrodia cinnamomea]